MTIADLAQGLGTRFVFSQSQSLVTCPQVHTAESTCSCEAHDDVPTAALTTLGAPRSASLPLPARFTRRHRPALTAATAAAMAVGSWGGGR